MPDYVTQEDIAKSLDLSKSAVSQMKRRGKIPAEFLRQVKHGDQMRDQISTDFIAWHKQNKSPAKKSGPPPGIYGSKSQQEKDADLAIKIYKAKKLKMEVEEKEGLFILRSDFEQALGERAAGFRQDLESMCRSRAADIVRTAGGLPANVPTVVDLMLKMIYKFLERYSR